MVSFLFLSFLIDVWLSSSLGKPHVAQMDLGFLKCHSEPVYISEDSLPLLFKVLQLVWLHRVSIPFLPFVLLLIEHKLLLFLLCSSRIFLKESRYFLKALKN